MTRKDIYVFKAKFGVGNFEIEVYKLPVKKETAKAYFVDDHYTYRKKVLKEEIGLKKELISEIMNVKIENVHVETVALKEENRKFQKNKCLSYGFGCF